MMRKLLLKFWAPLLLFLLVVFLFSRNYTPGTYLSGWDNLHPEFNPLMNLERSWQAAWQEYQGLGLLAGMAHGADFFRQLVLLPLTLLLPADLFRYVWHFLMVLGGVLGSFYLFKFLLNKNNQQNTLAFLGASFYLLNFGTVQNFYVTFEPFAAFYAFLPILLLLLLRMLFAKQILGRDLILFISLSVFSSSMAYVQTIFIVYLALVCLLFIVAWWQNHQVWRKILLLLCLILMVNSFWLLNVLHFTAGSAQLLADSKGKAMSNDILILKNQAFADYGRLAKLQGFWLNEVDFDEFGNNIYLFDSWNDHFNQPLVIIIAWLFCILLLLGFWQLFSQRSQHRFLIISLFILSVWMMALELFPFSLLTRVFGQLPLFSEMFRINFTKWVVPFSLFYGLLLTFGLAFLFSLFKKRLIRFIVASIFFGSLLVYSWPAFQGHFFYERLRVQIPEAYFELFDYFKHQAPASSRIANLPQHSFYGWQWNDWGYRGSGFIWYGIKQPILDRAFDVWSTPLEGYYWELQYALDQKNIHLLEEVLSKYDVDYLLLDASVVNRNTSKPFNYDQFRELLSASSQIRLHKQYDFLWLYEVIDLENTLEKDFVSLYDGVPVIDNDYRHNWHDQAYLDFHDYIQENNNSASNAKIIYPFASLFTNHSQALQEFTLSEDEQFFYLQSNYYSQVQAFSLNLPDFLAAETQLPFQLTWRIEDKQVVLTLEALLPELYQQNTRFSFDFSQEIVLSSEYCQKAPSCHLVLNNQVLGPFTQLGSARVLLRIDLRNVFALSTDNPNEYFDYAFFDLSDFSIEAQQFKMDDMSPSALQVKLPKIMIYSDLVADPISASAAKNCRPLNQGSFFKEKRADGILYQATGTSSCDHFYLENLRHSAGYLFRLDVSNLSSLPFVFAIQAESLGRSPIETYLDEGVNYQIVPPIESFHSGYTMYLSTDSYGRETNQNLLRQAEVYWWPYNFLSQLRLETTDLAQESEQSKAQLADCDFSVDKKALWFYQVDLPNSCTASVLKLSQAHDRGWLAWSDGEFLPHLKFNNWANAWQLPESTDNKQVIYLFFWPQLLQYFGFALLIGVFIYLARLAFSAKK